MGPLLDSVRIGFAMAIYAACIAACSSSSGYAAFKAVDGSTLGQGATADPTSGGDAEPAADDGGGASPPGPGGLFPPASPPASAPGSADAMSCANLGCFDVFDCAIFHPAEFGPCGFTQCVGLVCK